MRRALAAAIVVVVMVNAVVLALPQAALPWQAGLTDRANLIAAALAAGCASWRAAPSADRSRWSRSALAAGCASWTAGQVEWIHLTGAGTYSYPSPADAAFLLFPLLASAALLLHPTDSDNQRLRRVLDGIMTGLAAGLVIWAVALRSVVEEASTDRLLASAVSIARPTAPTPGAKPAPSWASLRNGPAPTDLRPMARSRDATARWPMAGRSAGSTSASHNGGRRCQAGCTSTTVTDPTPPLAATRPSAG